MLLDKALLVGVGGRLVELVKPILVVLDPLGGACAVEPVRLHLLARLLPHRP